MEAKGKRTARAPAALGNASEATVGHEAPGDAEPLALPIVAALAAPQVAHRKTAQTGDFAGDALAALAESQAVLARGLENLSAEAAGLARRSIDTAARGATEMLGIKTLSDAIEVNLGVACRSFETLLAGSVRLSELGVKLATDAVAPILVQFGREWSKAALLYR